MVNDQNGAWLDGHREAVGRVMFEEAREGQFVRRLQRGAHGGDFVAGVGEEGLVVPEARVAAPEGRVGIGHGVPELLRGREPAVEAVPRRRTLRLDQRGVAGGGEHRVGRGKLGVAGGNLVAWQQAEIVGDVPQGHDVRSGGFELRREATRRCGGAQGVLDIGRHVLARTGRAQAQAAGDLVVGEGVAEQGHVAGRHVAGAQRGAGEQGFEPRGRDPRLPVAEQVTHGRQ